MKKRLNPKNGYKLQGKKQNNCVSVLEPVIISVLCHCLGDRHNVNLVTPVFVQAITSNFVPGLGNRRCVFLVFPVLMTAIISVLCPPSWCPLLCLPCVSVLMPALMSTLCPRLGAHHHISLLSWCSLSCLPCVSVLMRRNHVNIVSPSWCPP